jgi:hypothetical protein
MRTTSQRSAASKTKAESSVAKTIFTFFSPPLSAAKAALLSVKAHHAESKLPLRYSAIDEVFHAKKPLKKCFEASWLTFRIYCVQFVRGARKNF